VLRPWLILLLAFSGASTADSRPVLALVIDDLERLAQAIAQEARAGDHVVIMSNGGFAGLHGLLEQGLGRRFSQ